ncbi:uncharacterized protein LOC5520919 isoform X2 [Nematostella vectensis]|uniref:uncharacterized protein LOC5520919 isoform X2 n=1 Tax=Nematostella vectensis TaxID=45351 RepID=UPI0020779185|nr:uncharacterized protein LOC5520919 isoform X2 [Nematostella vectensis]
MTWCVVLLLVVASLSAVCYGASSRQGKDGTRMIHEDLPVAHQRQAVMEALSAAHQMAASQNKSDKGSKVKPQHGRKILQGNSSIAKGDHQGIEILSRKGKKAYLQKRQSSKSWQMTPFELSNSNKLETNYVLFSGPENREEKKYKQNEFPRTASRGLNSRILLKRRTRDKSQSQRSRKGKTKTYGFLRNHGAKFSSSKMFSPTPFYIDVDKLRPHKTKPHKAHGANSGGAPESSPHYRPTQTGYLKPTEINQQRKKGKKFVPTQTSYIDIKKKGVKPKNGCVISQSKGKSHNKRALIKCTKARNQRDHTRTRRQVFGMDSVAEQNAVTQQLLQGLLPQQLLSGQQQAFQETQHAFPGVQQVLPDSQQTFADPLQSLQGSQQVLPDVRQTFPDVQQSALQGSQQTFPDLQQVFQGSQQASPDAQVLGMFGGPGRRGGVQENSLNGDSSLLHSLLGQPDPLSWAQQELQQPQTAQPQPLPQDTLPSSSLFSSPADPLTALGYQDQISQALSPVSPSPVVVPGQARHSIPLGPQPAYGGSDLLPYEDRRSHYLRHRRPHRRRFRYRPDTPTTFEDTYGRSPGIFDDLKDIGSQIDQYDDMNYGQRYTHRRHRHRHHHPHRHRGWAERDRYREAYVTDRVPHRPAYKEPADEVRGDSHDDNLGVSTGDRIVAAKEHSSLRPEAEDEVTENPTKDEVVVEQSSPKKGSDKTDDSEKEEKVVEYPHKNEDDALAVPETTDAELKRKDIINRLEKEAVMHLDFDETSQKKNIVKDVTSNGNNADLTNGAAVTAKPLGTCGRGAILNKGEVSYRGKDFKHKPTDAVSIAMWVKSKNSGFIRWFDQSEGSKDSFFASTKFPAVPKKRWTHLVGTFDTKTGEARVYLNGQLKLEKIGKKNSGLPQDFTSAGIGRKFGDDHVTFLDDVYMFDRVISPEEVKALYRKCEFNRMVLHYGFQHWNSTTSTLEDQSGLHNNATLKSGARVLSDGCDKCGACVDLSSNDQAEVYLNASKYKLKPTSAVTVSAWVSLNRTSGLHSIFQALKGKTDNTNVYNLEVIDGRVHWESRDKSGKPLFDVKTIDVTIPEGLWTHVMGTYSAQTGNAKIYVNGLLRESFTNPSRPRLSAAWERASIGGYVPGNHPFNGLLDEFFMYNWELDPTEARFVLKYCADKPKLVSFTVKVPIL